MAKDDAKKKAKVTPAGDLTTVEIKKITDELVTLREKIRDTEATVLRPTPEWDKLRKEIALLNKQLNADTAAKRSAREAAEQPPVAP